MAVSAAEFPNRRLARSASDGPGLNLEATYRDVFPRLVRFCRRRTSHLEVAEDLAQETVLRALKYQGTYDSRRPFWPWLKMIAVRVIADHESEKRREREGITAFSGSLPVEVDDESITVTERSVLALALGSLAPRQRTAMSLRYLDDWDPSEVAQALGTSKHAVEQLLVRSRQKLRAEYRWLSRQSNLGAILVPLLTLKGRLRSLVLRLRHKEEAVGIAPATVPALNLVIGFASVALAGLLLMGTDRVTEPVRESRTSTYSSEEQAVEASFGRQEERVQGSPVQDLKSVSLGLSTASSVEVTTGASAAASAEAARNSARGKLEAKLGDHNVEIPAGTGDDGECDYSAIRQSICDAIDILPQTAGS